MQILNAVFLVVVIIFSAIIHEVMHGVAADRLGDPTARYAGRLTLNPFPHIDPMGSIIVPFFLVLIGSPILFGYAKPVPYNPYNLKPGRFSEAIVAAAGPFSNLVIALFAGVAVRTGLFAGAADAIFLVVVVNVMLCIFNLIPVPPLDGSKVLEALLPRALQYGYANWRHSMEVNPLVGTGIVLFVIIALGGVFSALIYAIAGAIA